MKQPTHRLFAGIAVAAMLTGLVAFTTTVPASAEGAAPGPCYEQVLEQRYQRPTIVTESEYTRQVPMFETQHEIDKQVRGNIEHSKPNGAATTPFDWTDWPGAGPVWDDGRNRGPSGHSGTFTRNHDGHTDTYRATSYRYVETGNTRQVPNGTTTETQWFASNPGDPWKATGTTRSVSGQTEDSGWVTTPPAGDGWEFVDDRQVDGKQKPCDEKPNDGFDTRSTDGTCGSGNDVVTVEHFRTPYTFVLDGEYQWVKTPGDEQQLEPTTRTLTDAEQVDCKPVKEDKVVRVDGEVECNDTTVDQTMTTTSYTYHYVDGVWVETASVAETSTKRQLDDDETSACPGPTATLPKVTTTEPGETTTTTTTTTTVTAPTTNPVAGDGGTVPPREETTTTIASTTTVPVVGDGGTVPPSTPTGSLPRTGGSGSSGILQLGALLLVAGSIVVVAARRRNPAPEA